jgi:uncharacterized DUF497 family protein
MERIEAVSFDEFEWDERKRLYALDDRGIDFRDAAAALLKPHLEARSDRYEEIRSLAICEATKRIIAVVYTVREERCRIISARPARRYEREKYHEIFGQ